MSALAADACILERRGVPVIAIGGEALIRTTGRAMARLHGYTDLAFVPVRAHWGIAPTDEHVQEMIREAIPLVEKRLWPDRIV